MTRERRGAKIRVSNSMEAGRLIGRKANIAAESLRFEMATSAASPALCVVIKRQRKGIFSGSTLASRHEIKNARHAAAPLRIFRRAVASRRFDARFSVSPFSDFAISRFPLFLFAAWTRDPRRAS